VFNYLLTILAIHFYNIAAESNPPFSAMNIGKYFKASAKDYISIASLFDIFFPAIKFIMQSAIRYFLHKKLLYYF